MTRGEPKRPDDSSKILQFRPRGVANGCRKRVTKNAERDLGHLLDLSRYENPERYEDPERGKSEFRVQMTENVAAVVVLLVLIAIGTCDVIGLEQIQHCASAGSC